MVLEFSFLWTSFDRIMRESMSSKFAFEKYFIISELLVFLYLSIVRNSKYLENTTFRKHNVFPSLGEGIVKTYRVISEWGYPILGMQQSWWLLLLVWRRNPIQFAFLVFRIPEDRRSLRTQRFWVLQTIIRGLYILISISAWRQRKSNRTSLKMTSRRTHVCQLASSQSPDTEEY